MAVETRKRRRWPLVLAGVVGVLLLAGFIALQRLDAWLLARARSEAAALSQRLGRPVQIGGLSTQLFPHLGVELEALEVGAAPGEEVPLVRVEAVDVRVDSSRALTSRGQDIVVENAEVSGLTLNVVRLPDGTTNVQRLQERLAQTAPAEEQPPAQPEQPQPAQDLSRVRVDRAALTDGRIRLIDRTGPQARELTISDLDVEVRDLRAGQPLEVVLKAAVLAERQNLEMRLKAAPLPPTLVPTPERLTLKAEPIDLTPLAPFLPPSVGLQGGRLQADWTAELGAAVPGGQGPTRLVGGLRAEGLRFAGAEGGKALDVVLDTNIQGDVQKGDLALDTLRLDFGPAGLSGKGRVAGLTSQTPRVEGLEIVGRNLDPALLATYWPALRAMLPGEVAGPIGLRVTGEGTQAAQALQVQLDFTPVRLAIPQQLTKAAGAPMRLVARLTGAAAGGGGMRFDANADLAGVDLRPGLAVDKAPGQRMEIAAQGTWHPGEGGQGMRVEVPSYTAHLLDDTVTGRATYVLGGEAKKPTQTFSVEARSAHLDADRLLIDEKEAAARGAGPAAAAGAAPGAPAAGSAAAVPAQDPHRFDGMRGDVKAQVDTLRYNQMDLTNASLAMRMVDDAVTVQTFRARLFGGQVSATDTTVRLGPAEMPFDAKVKVESVDMGRALALFSDKPILSGLFSGDFALKGAGTAPDLLQQTLAGIIQGQLADGRFLGGDIVAQVTEPLAKALPFSARALQGERFTALGDQLPFGLEIKEGVAQLSRPISVTRDQARLQLSGGIGLDGALHLAGTVALSPAVVSQMTGGRAQMSEPLPIALQVTGPAWAPRVTGLDLKPAVKLVAQAAAANVAGRLLGEKGKAVQGAVAGGEEAARAEVEKRRQEAEAKAAEESERLKQKAREEAQKKLKGLFGR